MTARWVTPISTTIVPPTLASERQSTSGSPLRRCPVTDRDGGRHAAVGHRDTGRGRRGEGRRHARHDLERHAGVEQGLRFLATATEHERVAALQPHDVRPLSASVTSSAEISSWGTPGQDACRRRSARPRTLTRASTPSPTRASWTTTSAAASSRAARTVSRSGHPDLRRHTGWTVTASAGRFNSRRPVTLRRRRTTGSGSHVSIVAAPTPSAQSPNGSPSVASGVLREQRGDDGGDLVERHVGADPLGRAGRRSPSHRRRRRRSSSSARRCRSRRCTGGRTRSGSPSC